MSDAIVHLSGNLGKAPEIAAGKTGNLYCRFGVATTERKKNQDGTWSDGDTSWWNCTAFGNTAEMIVETLDKGDPVTLAGKIKIRSYEQNGETRQSADITVDTIGLDLSRAKRKSAQSRQQPQYTGEAPF